MALLLLDLGVSVFNPIELSSTLVELAQIFTLSSVLQVMCVSLVDATLVDAISHSLINLSIDI